jgi:hypothetical protein
VSGGRRGERPNLSGLGCVALRMRHAPALAAAVVLSVALPARVVFDDFSEAIIRATPRP